MNEIIIFALSFIILLLVIFLIFFYSNYTRIKNNADFDYANKKFIVDEMSKLFNQNQELFNALKIVANKIDDNKLYARLKALDKKITKLEHKVNNDYQVMYKNEYDKKEKEKDEED